MAFSFGNTTNALMGSPSAAGGSAAPSAGGGATTQGPDLELITTEGMGFLSIAGDAKVRLTSKWTDLPSPTATLISIASKKGLVAAAGPDAVHIATTEAVRKAFSQPKAGDSEVRPFEPQAKLPLPVRISQLAFTADEQYLVISAEVGGGLAVYDVQAVSQGSTQPVMEISTSGETLRALIPNPMPEMAELVVAVTNNGNLLVANLKQASLVSGPNGPVLRSQVSCAAWSTKGKQLVAGLADGTVEQMTPDGTVKAQIPRPPALGDFHVASIAWLENNVFLVIHNETNGVSPSAFHIITREKGSPPSFVFQKMTDPVEPYTFERKPHHSVLRLRDFPPNLQDLLLVSSTAREAIGLLTRATSPLTSASPADKITNVFTTTEFADDSARAQLPLSEDFTDTFPVGTALDLSSKDKVYKPIPADEMDESSGPLPGLWALNNEGVLSAWWIVYNDSVRQGTTYPGIIAAQGAAAPASTTPKPAQSSSGFGSPGPASAFGKTTAAPALVNTAAAPAFGGTSALGAKASPWASTPTAPAFGSTAFGGGSGAAPSAPTSAFGGGSGAAPAFGSPSALGGASKPAFGQSSSLGGGFGAAKASPWGTPGGAASSSPAFGQTAFGSGAASSSATASGGFSSFANKGGFASLASGSSGGSGDGGSIFGSGKPSSAFGTVQGSTNNDTSFPPKQQQATTSTSSPFGSSPFVLGSTFKPDPKTANDNEKPSSSGGSLFGSGFGLTLGEAAKAPPAPEANMDAPTPAEKPNPFSAPAAAKPSIFGAPSSTTTKSIFDTAKKESSAPPAETKNPFSSTSAAPFGLAPSSSAPPTSLFGSKSTTSPPSTNTFGAPSYVPSTTPASSPEPSKYFSTTADAPPSTGGLFGGSGGLFGNLKPTPSGLGGGSLFGSSSATVPKKTDTSPQVPKTPVDASTPLPPESTSKAPFSLSGSSSGSSTTTAADVSPLLRVARHALPAEPMPTQDMITNENHIKVEEAADDDLTSPPETRAAKRSPSPEPAVPEEAPLPPDPVREKSKYNFADIPPLPGMQQPKKPQPAAAPVPAPQSLPKLPVEDSVPDQPIPSGSEGELSEEDEVEEEEEEEEEEAEEEVEDRAGSVAESEGSGVDVAKDLSPTTSTAFGRTPGYTPQSSFGGVGASVFSLPQPADQSQSSRRLFGEVSRNAPVLPQPLAVSPRSPSPVRGAGVPSRMFRPEGSRSVSAPGMASQILGTSTNGSRLMRKPSNLGMGGASPFAAAPRPQQPTGAGRLTPDPNVEQQRKSQARKEADESQVLSDQEDDWKQEVLNAPPEPTLELAEFLPNVGNIPKAGRTVPEQAEAMYRDINRMVDTLGLNARHLKEFIMGHAGGLLDPEALASHHRTKEDLEEPDAWILLDAKDVGRILEEELAGDLDAGRVHDVDEVLESCRELARGLGRLRVREMDLKKSIISRLDPGQAHAARSLPLGAEQAAQQADLRRVFTRFLTLLVEAEEAVTLLRTRMAHVAGGGGGGPSTPQNGGKVGVVSTATPTVDAVIRTVRKLTNMVEKRSGDVDVLETQVRKLRLQGVLPGDNNGSANNTPRAGSSRASPAPGGGAVAAAAAASSNSPFSTPQKKRHSRSLLFSPGSQLGAGAGVGTGSVSGSPARGSGTPSAGAALGATPRKKLSGFTDADKAAIREKHRKRAAVLARLKESLEKNGPNVMRMGDDD